MIAMLQGSAIRKLTEPCLRCYLASRSTAQVVSIAWSLLRVLGLRLEGLGE